MNIDEMKEKMAEQDWKLDRIIRLNTTAVREVGVSKTRGSLRKLGTGVVIELVFTLLVVVWLGHFIAGHVGEPKFWLPAVLIDACAILLAGSCIRQLMAVGGLDYGGSVVAVQRELENVRVLRITTTKWTLLLSLFLWIPLFIVGIEGLLGVDSYLVMAAVWRSEPNFILWIVANLLFPVVCVFLVMFVSNRYADRFDRSPFVKSVMDDIAGRSLMSALQSLDTISRFEDEVEAG